MSLKKILFVAVTTLVVYGGFAMPCQAQHSLKRRAPLRWLGQGFSDGYHRHNPGHDTSYYNPYTAHNSHLVSQSPEYQSILAQQQPPSRFFSGVPYSVYAAPSQLNPGIQNLPGQQVQGSFSPSVGSGVLDSEKDPENSFKSIRENDDRDFGEDDDNDFRENDNDAFGDDDDAFGDDDDAFGDDDDAFGDDDDAFGDDDDAFGDESMEMKKSMDDMDVKDIENIDTSDLGGLSGLNDSLSFDHD